MQRCIGYTKNKKKCRTRTKNDYFCCSNHEPYNLQDILKKCYICCEQLTVKELTILKCGHAHHTKCLHQLLQKTNVCPYCRNEIYKYQETNNKYKKKFFFFNII